MLIAPGLIIFIFPYKFITVDSNPIFDLPPSKTKLIFFPNSSITSRALIGLILVDIFALGIARGKFNFFNKFFIILCLGNLTAIIFKLAFAEGHILESLFFFRIKVNGPGENFL